MGECNWCQKAVFIEDINLNTYFSSSKDYYFGDPNSQNISDFDDPKWHLPLPTLSFNPDKEDWSDAHDIEGNEVEFGSYYRTLIETAYEHGHNFNTFRHYFWMRSSFISEQHNVAIGFPWYDTKSEFSSIYQWIVDGKEGEEFFDIEQGWQINGVIRDSKIYLLEADDSSLPVNLQTSEIFNNVYMQRDTLKSLVKENKRLVEDIIQKLTQEIGVDVWTSYHYKDDLKFGTKEWRPKKPSGGTSIFKRFFEK